MFRKATIVVLTVGAVRVALLWAVSPWRPLCTGYLLTNLRFEALDGHLLIGVTRQHDLSKTGGPPNPFTETHWYEVPLLPLTILFVAYPLSRPLKRWKRQRQALCVECGYNLTGNVSGVCPECGTGITKP